MKREEAAEKYAAARHTQNVTEDSLQVFDWEISEKVEAAFIAGAKWEEERSKWFDPSEVLPPIDGKGVDSITVLCKLTNGVFVTGRYDNYHGYWYLQGKVDKWAFIP